MVVFCLWGPPTPLLYAVGSGSASQEFGGSRVSSEVLLAVDASQLNVSLSPHLDLSGDVGVKDRWGQLEVVVGVDPQLDRVQVEGVHQGVSRRSRGGIRVALCMVDLDRR